MKNCIITGGNSGIGFQAAKQIAEKGHRVTLICRNKQRAEHAVLRILEEVHNGSVDYLLADLSSMSDIRRVAEEYLLKNSTLDVLINNAADFDLSVRQPVITPERLEKQFAVNVAAPYMLSMLFMDALNRSDNGRIINISSKGLCAYPFIKLDMDNLDGSRHYSPASTYYQNKLALLMLSLYMREQYPNISVQAIRVTNVKVDLSRYDHLPGIMKKAYSLKAKFSISPERMARIYTLLATEDGNDGFMYNENGENVKANRAAYDRAMQEKLCAFLKEITCV